MSGARKRREDVLRRMLRLADQKNNDSVKLAFMGEDRAEEIGGMDLGALTEVKRHGNGSVEVKVVNRLDVLEKLFGMLQNGGGEEIKSFLDAMQTEGKKAEQD